ncbi:hypothetical protein [Longitalea luteola]|uniref:hypothetical protein n=1 Tax=Longitalea luteola TaxID=2812563 RepID=UPI001A95CE7C|nr:hypothetical protein [Longitalea luteola]
MVRKLHAAYIVCLLLQFVIQETVWAQTTLVAGDIVVVGLNADDAYPNQRWAFITTRSIAAGTVIHFTDKGYDATTGNFRLPNADPANENDGYMTWTVPSPIAAGVVIFATNNTVNGSTSGVTGQLGSASGGEGFTFQGDQIIVYQGTSGTAAGATFIYAINTGQHVSYGASPGSWTTTGTVDFDHFSYLPPGLTNGSTAVSLTSNVSNTPVTTAGGNFGYDNMYYGGPTTGTRAALLTAIGNPANWLGNNTTAFNLSSGGVLPGTFSVLPVTLLHLRAEEATTGTVTLNWSTAMEINNDHFTIERSGDGIHYTVIAMLPGKGNYDQPTDYLYTDHTAGQGDNFYRLSQTDRDGKMTILGVRLVTIQQVHLQVGPNPAVHYIDAAFNRGDWHEIKLYNSADQLLQQVPLAETTTRIRIGLQNYRPGTYYVAFIGRNGKGHTVRRIVRTN